MTAKSDRRTFLKWSVGGAAAAAVGSIPTLKASAKEAVVSLDAGERYGEFLILPHGTGIPSVVQKADMAPPAMCGAGQVENKAQVDTIAEPIKADGALLREVAMESPVYKLSEIPADLEFQGGYVVRYGNSLLHHTIFGYEKKGGAMPVQIGLQSALFFPRPYPVHHPDPLADAPVELAPRGFNTPGIEKVSFLPAPGVLVRGPLSLTYHWIQFDVLYTLWVQGHVQRKWADQLAESLTLI